MTITEFLLARIAEDEGWARQALEFSSGLGVTREWRWVRFYGPTDRPNLPSSSAFYKGCPDPERVLAECEAKRRIVERSVLATSEDRRAFQDYSDWIEGKSVGVAAPQRITSDKEARGLELAVQMLAAVYADHPDYDQTWTL